MFGITCFIPTTSLPLRSGASRPISHQTKQRPPICMAKKRPAKSNKANKPKTNAQTPQVPFPEQDGISSTTPMEATNTEKNDIENAGRDTENADPYVPRGPTLRAEYERKGIIDPIQYDRDAGVLPEQVANRMIRRIITFGGTPLTLLFAFFALYFVLKYKYDITVLPVVVATSTLGTIGLATAGITYGILSSSWDEEEEGSRVGWKEFKVNFMRARDGVLSAVAREKKEEEIDRIDRLADEIEKENKSKKKGFEKTEEKE